MGKTVLITGSSSGIGKATAELFVKNKWNVVATMRSPEKEKQLAAGANLVLTRLDVLDDSSIGSAIEDSLTRFGKIDALVNNAGYGLIGPFEASTKEQVERQFATNVFGLMNVTRAMLPHFRQQKSGVIINIASVGGRMTFPLYSVYHATKWAIEGFTESLQFELAGFGIRVKIIEPGIIKTDFYDRSRDLISKKDLTAYDAYTAKTMPKMEKAGETAPGPELVANVIYAAATDGSSKLRYQANSEAILAMRRFLPESVFYQIVRNAVE